MHDIFGRKGKGEGLEEVMEAMMVMPLPQSPPPPSSTLLFVRKCRKV